MEIRDSINAVPECLKQLKADGSDVILYGAGYCGHEALSLMTQYGISVRSVCDDFRAGEQLDGYKIVRLDDICPNEKTVIFITSGFNAKMKQRIEDLGLLPYYREIDFGRYDADKENAAYFKAHEAELRRVWTLLSDDKSRNVLQNLVNYRISRDLKFLAGMEEEKQYFPPKDEIPVLWDGADIFLDLGAYDGDSVRGFIAYADNKYKKIIAVEASRKNYKMLVQNTEMIPRVQCVNIGVHKKKGQVRFEVSDAKNSFASEDGADVLEVDSVDHILNGESVTTIKMDIEGAEYDAILGMEKTLQNHPVLMVSIYHKVEDLFRLQLLIEKMCPNVYDFYIRHYSPTIIETVLYAVPKKLIFY